MYGNPSTGGTLKLQGRYQCEWAHRLSVGHPTHDDKSVALTSSIDQKLLYFFSQQLINRLLFYKYSCNTFVHLYKTIQFSKYFLFSTYFVCLLLFVVSYYKSENQIYSFFFFSGTKKKQKTDGESNGKC